MWTNGSVEPVLPTNPPDFLTHSPRSCRVCRGTWETSVVEGADWDIRQTQRIRDMRLLPEFVCPVFGGSVWTWAATWDSVTLASGRQWNGEEWSLFRGWAETFDNNLIGWVEVTPELEAEDPRGPEPPLPPCQET